MKFINSVLTTIFGTEDLIAAAELEKEDPDDAEYIIAENEIKDEPK